MLLRSVSRFTSIVVVLCLFLPAITSGGMVANGDLSDWGLNLDPATGSLIGLTNGTGSLTHDGFSFNYAYAPGVLSSGLVADDYDTIFLAMGVKDDRLAIAIVTNQRPDNGALRYSPGDIHLQTTNGSYGVEVGGGLGGKFGGGAIGYGESYGSTYKISTSGNTIDYAAGLRVKSGYVVENPDWHTFPWTTPGSGLADPYDKLQINHLRPGTIVSTAETVDFYHGRNDPAGSPHTVIEVLIDLSVFGEGNTILGVHWSPASGHDLLSLSGEFGGANDGPILDDRQDTTEAPEPSSILMFAFGTLGCGMLSYRRRVRLARAYALAAC
jgi:hypothetical protein